MATPQIYYKDSNSWKSALLNSYPVGAIYMSSSGTSPANLFGGTWEQIKDGRFWQPNASYGGTGGESSHKLSVSEMPGHQHTGTTSNVNLAHQHSFGADHDGGGGNSRMTVHTNGSGSSLGGNTFPHQQYTMNVDSRLGNHNHTFSTSWSGGNSAHNNTPLYRTCFCWRRTA